MEKEQKIIQTPESMAELIARLQTENVLPDLSAYKEVWMRDWSDKGIFFCKKNVIWWIIECDYDSEGKICNQREARAGKISPAEEMRIRYGVSKDQFKAAFKRIK